jgi:hypothetical protein
MITLKKYLEATQYKVYDGSEFLWKCYGPHARFLDCGNIKDDLRAPYWTTGAVFDAVTQEVYDLRMWNCPSDSNISVYYWINPKYIRKHNKEAREREAKMFGKRIMHPDALLSIIKKIVKQHELGV